MGLDVHARLVVGLPTNQVLQVKTVTDTVTKYDPDTGKPYQKVVESKDVMIFGRAWPYNADFELHTALKSIHPDLMCFRYDSERYHDLDMDRIIGFEVKGMAGRCEGNTRYPVTQTEIDDAMVKFKSKFGRTAQMYLTMEYSY